MTDNYLIKIVFRGQGLVNAYNLCEKQLIYKSLTTSLEELI
jgi:hypothetical protein